MQSALNRADRRKNNGSLPTPSHQGREAFALRYAAVVAVTLIAYGPAWRAGLVWNDLDYVTQPALRSWAGLARIWFRLGATEQYYPLLHSFFWVQHRLWGDAPLGYHAVNLTLHAFAACLFGAVFSRLRGAARLDTAGWIAALLFTVHPIGVESAAWISEQKNTWSLVFYLLSATAFLRFRESRSRSDYLWASLAFACALLSKTVAATLPGGLLVAIWWKDGHLRYGRDVRPLVPWFVAGAAAGLGSAWVERVYVGAGGAAFALTWLQRLLLAGRMPWFYLGKLLWPAHLVFIYPRWDLRPADPRQWAGVCATLAALLVAWAWRRRSRTPLAASLFFLGSLFPTLGFLNVFGFRYSYVADHWIYLSSLAVFATAGAGLADLSWSFRGIRVGRLAAGVLAAGLSVLTWNECLGYRDVFTFYRTIIARNPRAWMAENNLGQLYADLGHPAQAVPHYRAALAVNPDLPKTRFNLGLALAATGQLRDAVTEYETAIVEDPQFADAYNNLGVALERLGSPDVAAREYRRVLELQPGNAAARSNLAHLAREEYTTGVGAFRGGAYASAAEHFAAAISLYPNFPEAENAWGAALARMGRPDEAIAHYQAALRLRPDFREALQNLASAQGRD